MFPGLPPDRVKLRDTWQIQRQGQKCGDILNLSIDSHLAWDRISASEDLPAFQGQTITCWGPLRGTLLFSQGAKGWLSETSVCLPPLCENVAPKAQTLSQCEERNIKG